MQTHRVLVDENVNFRLKWRLRLTDDCSVDLHLPVLLCQMESLLVALGQNQEVDGRAIVVQAQEEPYVHKYE